jgi:hypothetical protein
MVESSITGALEVSNQHLDVLIIILQHSGGVQVAPMPGCSCLRTLRHAVDVSAGLFGKFTFCLQNDIRATVA